MNRRNLFALAAFALIARAAVPRAASAAAVGASAHDFAFTDIDGAPMPLSQFAGKALLVVNTASRCGFTGQYAGLQALWKRYRDKGLVVIGVPSDAYNQELSGDAAVKDFCETNYSVDFPLTAITEIKGPRAHPFYAWAAQALGPMNAPRWNFHKYLIDGEGRAAAAFGTSVEPMSAKVLSAVDKVLTKASPAA